MKPEEGRRCDAPENRQDLEIFREATRLLNQMSFWSNRGAYAEGRYVAISVDPRWNEDNETIQVALTCYAFGQQQMDWQALPIVVRPAGTTQPLIMARLNARGQGLMPRLKPDDYRLFVPRYYGRSEAPLPFSAHEVHGNLAAATGSADERIDPHIYESPDGSVIATVRRTLDGTTVVAFETEQDELADAVVYFAFVRTSGAVHHSASVSFTPVEEEPGLWEARWEAEIEFAHRCTFEFGVVPRDG